MKRKRGFWQWARDALWYPLLAPVAISHDARVDPAHFDVEEFPVWCPRCEYTLRGLPENRCPECGTPFDRGRLLVEQYIGFRLPKRDRWRRWSVWALRLAVAFMLIGILPFCSVGWGAAPLLTKRAFLWMGSLYFAGMALLLVSAALHFAGTLQLRKGRRRILEAMRAGADDQEQEPQRRAGAS